MTLVQEANARLDSVAALAASCYPEEGARDVMMIVDHEQGEKLPDGSWSGVGGHTRFGVAWMIEWKTPSAPIALYDTQAEARYLYALLSGEEGDLWQRRQRKLARIAELEAAEAAATAEAKAAAKAAGGGSSRPRRSNGKRSASTGTSSDEAQAASPRAYATIVSPRRSSSSGKSLGSSRGSPGLTTGPSSTDSAS